MVENFGDKRNTNGLDKNPENINKKGRPKKTYKEHIEEIEAKGYKAPTKQEYFDMVSLLLTMSEDDLKEYAEDKERPYWIRLLILDLNNANSRQRLMDSYRDWLYGKAEGKTDVTVTEKSKDNPYSNLPKEALEEMDEVLKKYTKDE